ncbi:MAG: hypothetical protein ABIY51_12170 [Ferruginibacter sp.]
MIEIIILIFLCRRIGNKASEKGLKAGWWKFYTVAAWVGAEILGIVIAVIFFGPENTFSIYSIAIAAAFGGYLLVNYLVDKAPSLIDDDEINNIGEDQEL